MSDLSTTNAPTASTVVIQMWIDPLRRKKAPPTHLESAMDSVRRYTIQNGYGYALKSHAHTRLSSEHHVSWQRIPYLLETLQSGMQVAAFLDADMHITNPALRIEQLMHACGKQAELVVASNRDHAGGCGCCLGKCPCLVNNGMLIMRNTSFVIELLSSMLRMDHSPSCMAYRKVEHREQDCLQLKLQAKGELPLNGTSKGCDLRYYPSSCPNGVNVYGLANLGACACCPEIG